ncbi:MAG: metal-dependent hydrolase [Steroidobacteraceae bacterium]
MDSLTHIVLGAAVGTAVLGRKAGLRAALVGAVCNTLPDLDVLIAHGSPVRDFTFHRAGTHALFWLTLAAPAIAWLVARLNRRLEASYREWLLLAWLSLVTHPLLDAFTVYGTQLLLPFSDYPVGVGSVFIIDPLFTVPMIVGLLAWLRLRQAAPDRGLHWNRTGLVASTLYLGWTVAAQAHVTGEVQRSIAATPLANQRVLVTPAPLNSLLWRVVVMDEDGYHEGFRSLFDQSERIRLARHASNPRLLDPLHNDWTVRRLAWFSKGFYSVHLANRDLRVVAGAPGTVSQLLGAVTTAQAAPVDNDEATQPIVMTDLRMGQTPWFVFSFVVAEHGTKGSSAVPNLQIPSERPPVTALPWLWNRIWDENATY